jgi:hypothetical protein
MRRKILGLLILCIAGTAGNYGLSRLSYILDLGLFLDTVLTIAVTFAGGLGAGLITAVLSTAAYGIGSYAFWGFYLFGLCSIAAVLLTGFFMRIFPKECTRVRLITFSQEKQLPAEAPQSGKPSLLSPVIMLFLLSLCMCILMSVLGGMIAVFIEQVLRSPISDTPPETYFKLGLLRGGLGLAAAEILARFPVNIVDRFISVFCAYGAALLVKSRVLST